jgi:hypothetical protein
MASVPMDALASFVYLTDHLPTWLAQIDTLATHVLAKREEFTAEYKRLLEHARPKRKKTESVTSLQPDDRQVSVGSQRDHTSASYTWKLPRRTEISPLEPANKYLFANARRGKRRRGTSFRSGSSGPQTFRNQHQVIIYYDSSLQNDFERLVKDIATARNNLRKGKQTRALERGLRLPSVDKGQHDLRMRSLATTSPLKSHSFTNITTEPKLLLNDTPPDDDASFTEVAKNLEAAQSLCETAAHQFLRDGDCISEIDQIRAHFESVLQVAKAHAKALEQEKSDPVSEIKDNKPTVETGNCDMATAVAEKIGIDIAPAVNTEATEIEVDSDDNDEEDAIIDISRFRATRTSGLRA